MLDVILVKSRDRALRRRHPWVLSGAIGRVVGDAPPGAFARVSSADGEVLGYGHWSPSSSLRVRMLAFGKEPVEEAACIESAIDRALRLRSPALLGETDGLRLVNAEGDGLPGLVVDRYADVLVARPTTAGMERTRPIWSQRLRQATGAGAALVRADGAAARREGFTPEDGTLWGTPPGRVWMRERAREYAVDLRGGQKTGFYLDQRGARDRVEQLADGRRVLDLFCYSGGFTVAALRGGASAVTAVDSSAGALALARENVERAGGSARTSIERGDAFDWIRACEESFDLLVVDPPPLARTRRDVARATRAYKDVALHALRRAAPDALAAFFGCSHHVGPDLFRKVLFGASLDAGRPLSVLEEWTAPPDHPVALDHPEGRYLTGLLVRVGGVGPAGGVAV